ncbi:MAG: hypothetical protein GY856_55670 [bacterium]|nr:hypothetical protein [bacterium]
MKTPLFPEGTTATFADYFKLDAEIEEVLEEFGFTFRLETCELPRQEVDQDLVDDLARRLKRALPHVGLDNEMARREFLIAPVVAEVAVLTDAKIRVEFQLKVDDRLQGKVDYFVRAKHNILIVEAKNAELERGIKQLAVELVALDRWLEESTEPRLYGAVSIGNVWQFGILDRSAKRFTQDFNTYTVPKDLKDILAFLSAILTE